MASILPHARGEHAALADPGQNGQVPKIAAATVAENRELRRDALLSAAATLMQRGGSFTMAEVAREVGLSRSAVYEYYSSAAELIADVIVDELTRWSSELAAAASPALPPRERIHAWLQSILDYVVDGRHALLRAAASIELPTARRAEVHTLHQALVAPLIEALQAAGRTDALRTARYVWGVAEVATNRIEDERADPRAEASALMEFVDNALAMPAAD
jgi:AcrR family transcriptional regulator